MPIRAHVKDHNVRRVSVGGRQFDVGDEGIVILPPEVVSALEHRDDIELLGSADELVREFGGSNVIDSDMDGTVRQTETGTLREPRDAPQKPIDPTAQHAHTHGESATHGLNVPAGNAGSPEHPIDTPEPAQGTVVPTAHTSAEEAEARQHGLDATRPGNPQPNALPNTQPSGPASSQTTAVERDRRHGK